MREMKDSGVPWIGEIPKGWNLMKGRYCYDILSGFPFASDRFSNSSGYPLIRIRDITSGTVETFFDGDYPVEYVIKSGDLLVGMDGDFNIRLWSGVNALLNQRCCKITEKSQYDRRWLYYVLPFNLELINSLAYSTTVKHLSVPDLKEADIPAPTLPEQQRIANFLDAKCAEIDAIVEQTRASIEEYKKVKQSVITEVVTKGIRGKRPMKDSGVEWIGEIPKEWTCDKVVRLFETIGSGTTPKSSDDAAYVGSVNWIQSGDLNGGRLTTCKKHVNEDTLQEYSALKLYRAPFLVIAMYGASVGNMSISAIDGCVNQACCVLKGSRLDEQYAFFAIKSIKDYLIYHAVGGGQPNIGQDTIKSSWLPVPSEQEQQEIASYLDEKCAAIDSLIASKEALITELEAYKKSIIYEYVTGKKEV